MTRALAPAALMLAAAIASAQPLTTAFTYQGSLTSAGAPASGAYDFKFTLYDAPAGGVQLGPQLCSDNLNVTAGAFAAQLDFGAQYAGQQRFLEIWVRPDTGLGCADNTGFAFLGPRQSLTAAPNSAFALTAATAANATQLNSQPASFYTNAANLTTGTLPDARLALTVARLNTTQTFTGATTFSTAPSFSAAGAPFSVSSPTLVPNLNADLLDGLNSSAFLQSIPVPLQLSGSPASNSIIKGSNASTGTGSMGVQGEITSVNVSGTSYGGFFTNVDDAGFGVFGRAQGASGRAVYGQANAATDANFGGYFTASGINGAAGVFALASAATGTSYGLYAQADSSSGRAVFGRATDTTGTTYGGYFLCDSTSILSAAVYGHASATSGGADGGHFSSSASSGTGVSGIASSESGNTTGVYGEHHAIQGAAVEGVSYGGSLSYGGVFTNVGSSGVGVRGDTGIGGSPIGVLGTTISSNGTAVKGEATANTGTTTGVWGSVESPDGTGVFGESVDPSGTGVWGFGGTGAAGEGVRGSTNSGRGVHGYAGASSGAVYGIYGDSPSTGGRGVYGSVSAVTGATYGVRGFSNANNATAFAVYAAGDLGCSGNKSFRIDHPKDPANKYLLHYCVESPEVLNAYSGKVTLNEQGEATIDLPPYFATINKDPRYTLTPIGAAMPLLHIAEEVSDDALEAGAKAAPGEPVPPCSFRIAGGAPNAKVSWEVKAIRNDLRMRLHGAPVELEKIDQERGKYQHPEYYGLPPDMGMDPAPTSPKDPPIRAATPPSNTLPHSQADLVHNPSDHP